MNICLTCFKTRVRFLIPKKKKKVKKKEKIVCFLKLLPTLAKEASFKDEVIDSLLPMALFSVLSVAYPSTTVQNHQMDIRQGWWLMLGIPALGR